MIEISEGTLRFYDGEGGDTPLITVELDGTVSIRPGVNVSTAATWFWVAVARIGYGYMLENERLRKLLEERG